MNKKIKTIIITLILTFSVSNAFASAAGGSHSHSASKSKIERNAKKAIINFVDNGKLSKTWGKAKLVESKKFEKEWKVSFINKKIKEKEKQVLNFYFTSYGKLKGANYKK